MALFFFFFFIRLDDVQKAGGKAVQIASASLQNDSDKEQKLRAARVLLVLSLNCKRIAERRRRRETLTIVNGKREKV